MKNLDIHFVNDQAPHACETCKKRKRKCDKGLPQCSGCLSKGFHCGYPVSGPKLHDVQSNNVLSQRNLSQQNRFPSVYFLDRALFQQGQMDIPTPILSIPSYVSDSIGDNADIRSVAFKFFASVHTYLPIISKKIFYDLLINPLFPRRADVAFLCLCMKLIAWKPSAHDSEPQIADYQAAKQYLLELESVGVLTVPLLQGRLLISMYEFGHGIYPAAYLSIGTCAAHAIALGLDDKRDSDEGRRSLSWVEQEERRRVWWAIVILERIVYLGSIRRPLVTHDPSPSDLLPSDDAPWDQGVTTPNYPINSPVGSEVNMGPFARLAHATHLLTLVIRHISYTFENAEICEEEVVQIDRTIRALMVVCEQESQRTKIRYCNPLSICASALMVLHSHYLSLDVSEPKINSSRSRELSWVAMQDLLQQLVTDFRETLGMPCDLLPEISPLVLDSVYKAGVFLVQFSRDIPSPQTTQSLQVVKDTLKLKNGRWKAAGAYLQILEARELINVY